MADTKCMVCGKKLDGPALYCDGCSNYLCMDCGVSNGYMAWKCPNCAGDLQQVTL